MTINERFNYDKHDLNKNKSVSRLMYLTLFKTKIVHKILSYATNQATRASIKSWDSVLYDSCQSINTSLVDNGYVENTESVCIQFKVFKMHHVMLG